MSVIFQTLQKLESSEPGTASPTPPVSAHVSADRPKKSLVLRVVIISLLVVVIIAVGFGAVYGVRQLTNRLQPDTERMTDPPRYTMPRPEDDANHPLALAGPDKRESQPAATRYYPPEQRGVTEHPVTATVAPTAMSVTSQAAKTPDAPPNREINPVAKPTLNDPFASPVYDNISETVEGGIDEDVAGQSDPLGQNEAQDEAWQMAEAARLAALQKSVRIETC